MTAPTRPPDPSPDLLARLERWAQHHPLQLGGLRLALLAVRVTNRFFDVRVTGLAAEMTYYTILSVFPLIAALGASLGFLERLVGEPSVRQFESAVLTSLDAIFTSRVTSGVIAPMVQGLLQQERAGFAIGGYVVSLFLASRIFRGAIHTLDVTYQVEEQRGTVALWALGFVFAVGAMVTALAVLSMIVVGPLLGSGRQIAEWLGLGAAFEMAWLVARGPVVLAVATGFLSLLYYAGPSARQSWRHSLPGAVFGMVCLVLVAIGFRTYLGLVGAEGPAIHDADEAVVVGAQVFGAVFAALLWIWLSAMVVLVGGVVNAEIARMRREPLEQASG